MKIKYHIILFLIISFIAQACNNSNDPKEPERRDLKLTPSGEAIVLDQEKEGEAALTFSWNKATPVGDEYTFSYLFQIDIADNNFASAIPYVTLGEDGSYSFTAGQLYDLIVDEWGQKAGDPVEIEARVAAKVDGPKFVYPEIAKTKVLVTTYVPESQPVYLVGTATEAGLDPSKAIKMEELSNGRLYSWKGKLNKGNFKFITTPGSMLPSYNQGNEEGTVVERTDESQPDTYFEIAETGTYYIYLSLKNMKVTYTRSKYDVLYLIGDATSAGWNFTLQMEQDKVNMDIYTYQGPLKAGEFKIIAGTNWEDLTFKPLIADAPVESGTIQAKAGDPDLKWKVTSDKEGTYLITLDVSIPYITFEKK